MTNEITIRPAGPDDAETISQQRTAMFEDIWGPMDPEVVEAMEAIFIPWVRRGLVDGSYRGWLACNGDGSAVAGGGLVLTEWMPNPQDLGAHRAYIANIYTAPAYRRLGLARRIVQEIVDWCQGQAIPKVSLHASPFGRPLYASLGFEPTNEMQLTLGSDNR